jgi:hypothetical protein
VVEAMPHPAKTPLRPPLDGEFPATAPVRPVVVVEVLEAVEDWVEAFDVCRKVVSLIKFVPPALLQRSTDPFICEIRGGRTWRSTPLP